MYDFKTVRELYETCYYGDQIQQDSLDEIGLEGWIRTNRNNGSIGFIELNDGTYFKNAQIVYDKEKINKMRLCKMLAMTFDITAIILMIGAYSIISMNDTIILGVITLIVGTILSNVVSKNK